MLCCRIGLKRMMVGKKVVMGMWLLSMVTAHAQAPGGPVKVESYEVKAAPFSEQVSTVGTLRANESVTLVAETSRRLVKILAQEGATVKKGELLFQLDDAELQAELQEIEAKLALALANKTRNEQLLPTKAISQLEVDIARAEWSILDAQKKTKLVEIERAQVRAPFDGSMGVRLVSEGAFLSPATPLTTLQDLSQMKIDFSLPERYASVIKKGLEFSFTIAGQGKKQRGSITVIEPAIDEATRSLRVRGVCQAATGLAPGGFADVKLTLSTDSLGLMLPTQAIVPSPRGHGVYVIEDGKAKFQEIRIGTRTPEQVQVVQGLREGQIVATTNLNRVRPGVELSIATKP